MITALLMTQFIGIPCAFLFGMVASRTGALNGVFIGLAVYVLISVLGYFMSTPAHFFALAALVGMVQGGTQALSRSLFASMIPRHKSSEFFAFFSVFERYAGVLGPAHLRLRRQPQRIGADRHPRRGGVLHDRGGDSGLRQRRSRTAGGARRRSRAAPGAVVSLDDGRRSCPFRHPRRGAGDHGGLLPGRPIRCGSGQRPGTAAAESCQRPARSRGDLGHGVAGRPLPRQVDVVRRGVRADPEGCPRDPGLPPPGRGGRSGEERRDLRRGSGCILRRRRGLRLSGRDQSFHRQAGAAQDRRRQDGDRRRAGWGPRGDGRGGSELRSQDRVPVTGHRALWPAVHGRGSRGR